MVELSWLQRENYRGIWNHIKAGVVLSAVGCIINTTCELVIVELPNQQIDVEFDEETGYKELIFKTI